MDGGMAKHKLSIYKVLKAVACSVHTVQVPNYGWTWPGGVPDTLPELPHHHPRAHFYAKVCRQ